MPFTVGPSPQTVAAPSISSSSAGAPGTVHATATKPHASAPVVVDFTIPRSAPSEGTLHGRAAPVHPESDALLCLSLTGRTRPPRLGRLIGQVIGSYRIVAELGQGGMGVVYRAEHVQLGRPVAIKMLLPQMSSDPTIVQRFFNEARA